MKKFNKIMSLILIITIFLGTVNVYAYSEKYPNRITQTIVDEKQFAIQAYKNLDDEAKEVFLSYIQQLALEGDSSLLEYHIKYVDKNYAKQTIAFKKEVDSNTKKMYNMAVANNPSIANQLAALNLPAAVEYGLLAFASALGVPVGNVVDVVIGLGLAAVIAIYWDDIKDVWDDIVDIFVDEFGSFVKDAFNYLSAKAQGLPTEEEFHNFEEHYEKHAKEFADMPDGNGKKPDKKKYWEMAKDFLKKTGRKIKTGVDKYNSNRIVKFNTKTLEYLVYDKRTNQIITYYLPKWKYYHNNVVKWTIKAFEYFESRIR